MVSLEKRLELRKQQCAALRATADALDDALEAALAEKTALRSRLVAEIAGRMSGGYEVRMAEAEARVVEFEKAFADALRRNSQPGEPA